MKLEYSVLSPLSSSEILKRLSENTVGWFTLKSGKFRGHIGSSDFTIILNKSRSVGIEMQGHIREEQLGRIIDIKCRIGALGILYAFSFVGGGFGWVMVGYQWHAPFFFYCIPAFVLLINFAFGIREQMLLTSELSELIDGKILA